MIVDYFTGVSFLNSNRSALIQRVKNVDVILDHLVDIIGSDLISSIRKKRTSQKKMRRIFEIIENQGVSSQLKFFKLLYEHEKILIENIKERPENN